MLLRNRNPTIRHWLYMVFLLVADEREEFPKGREE
jgi:hypothetical protein